MTMLLKFSLDYSVDQLTPHQRQVLQAHVQDPERVVTADGSPARYIEHVGDVGAILAACPDLKLQVTGWAGGATGLQAVLAQLRNLATKVDQLTSAVPKIPEVNTACVVQVPGQALLSLSEVTVEVDCCTDQLQDCLQAGWRILAVCPQPGQRRPDYVLGRRPEP